MAQDFYLLPIAVSMRADVRRSAYSPDVYPWDLKRKEHRYSKTLESFKNSIYEPCFKVNVLCLLKGHTSSSKLVEYTWKLKAKCLGYATSESATSILLFIQFLGPVSQVTVAWMKDHAGTEEAGQLNDIGSAAVFLHETRKFGITRS